MTTQMAETEPRVMDTYSLNYAFTSLLLIPALFLIDRLSIVEFTPAYLALVAGPFLLGPVVVFLTDSRDGTRDIARRSAVLVPLVAITGILFIFGTMIVVLIPLGLFLNQEVLSTLAIISSTILVLLASPLLLALARRLAGGLTAVNLFQMGALVASLAVVGWIIVMAFDPGDTLATFIRSDLTKHFVGAFTWYLPAFALAAGLWRRTGIV